MHAINSNWMTMAYFTDYGGHRDFSKTYDRVLRNYYWPTIYKDIRQYIKSCPECQLSKANTETTMGLLQPIIPDRIMQQWCMDVHGPLPTTKRGNKYIVLFVDRFSGFTEGIDTDHTHSPLIANKIGKSS